MLQSRARKDNLRVFFLVIKVGKYLNISKDNLSVSLS